TSQLSIALVNWLITLATRPHYLPRMDFSTGIPPESSTLVVVPTMLLTEQNIESLCDALEVRFLANRDQYLRFCLLTDFSDAASETTDTDDALLRQAQQGIRALNAKYAGEPSEESPDDKFLLLHRPRRWNAQEKIWMGYERKRGKLGDLNAYLRDPTNNPFSCIVGDTTGLSTVKYVITLDTDTRLERDSARQFVGAMSHPLNRAVYDEGQRRVTQGYGILQPRVSTSLPARNASHYGLLFGGEPGIDPYTRTVSDVYQDVFGEGSFVGKGIYDVDAFEQALANRFPENHILSHDLLEGCYARCGLISDVQLHEEYPVRYSADVKRRHRWIRGDWQLAAWLFPRVPVAAIAQSNKRWEKNPLSTLSRWKLLDNLRRSVVPTALTSLFLLGWIILPSGWLWTTTVLSILFLPPLLASLIDLLRKPENVLLRQHIIATARYARQRFAQALLSLTFLPYETFYSLDAVVRTLWRQLISHKNLLEWNPSHAEHADRTTLDASYRRMWASPFIAIASIIVLAATSPHALWSTAAPILVLWLLAPAIAWWISQPLPRDEVRLTGEQTLFLHRLSRKIWAFFENYVGPDDNWLPPDNVQIEPISLVAHRTSPTNIGLALLATLAAHDFGYITGGQLIERCANTLRTMDALERHQGHFYNWYDTQHLNPLLPMYISTVDSGNLAGHLMTLRPGLLALLDQPIIARRLFDGIHDTLDVLTERVSDAARGKLNEFRIYLADACKSPPATISAALQCLHQLAQLAGTLADHPELAEHTDPITNRWVQALNRQCTDAYNDLKHLAPWGDTLHSPDWDAETL
ncbi:MAG TPA: cyclic beta 1-2 glucan synthetase, partial [Paralcaligenes sp.]